MATLAPVGFSTTVGGIAHNITDASMVYHVNLLLVAIAAFYVAIRIPRALALFGTRREWLDGHFLRYIPYTPSRQFVQAVHSAYPPPLDMDIKDSDSEYSASLYSATHGVQRLSEKGSVVMRFPPHIPACIKPLRPLMTPLRSRVAPGFSIGQLLVLLAYFYALIYATFYDSNIFTDNSRTGWIATAQLALVFAFAQKNNFLGVLLGLGYEKLNFLHRFAGRVVVLASNIHSFHYFYTWSLAGTFKQNMKRPNAIWGFIALLCVDILFFFSIKFVRQRAYNFFLRSHIFAVMLVLPAFYYHKSSTLPYVLACIAIYGFDRLLRLIKSRVTTAYIRPLPELDVTRVEIPSINAGWRAGQHIRLRVLSLQMGWLSWTETHPFTIASVSQRPEGMVLLCKRAGGWTRKLYDLAKIGGYSNEAGIGRDVKVIVEGPYGGPGHTIFSSFSAAVFIVGGSGITYALSAIGDLVQKDLRGESRLKVIELVWTVPDPACLAPILPILTSLVHQSVFTPIRISVFYTRAPTGMQPAFFSYSDASPVMASPPVMSSRRSMVSSPSQLPLATTPSHQHHPSSPSYFPPGLSLAPGRPKFNKILEGAIQRAVCLGLGAKDDEKITGMVVGVCGPVELGDDVAKAVGTIDPTRRDQVGGVEICEEVFGW